MVKQIETQDYQKQLKKIVIHPEMILINIIQIHMLQY